MGQISAKYFFKLYRQKIFAVNPSSAVGYVQLVPKYISKDRGQPPNYLSEIII